MDNCEENCGQSSGQKRKHKPSPDHQSGTDSKSNKKVKEFSSSLSEEDIEEDRLRTPSGTSFPKINNIRAYFSPSAKSNCERSKKAISCPSVNEISEPRLCAKEKLKANLKHGKSVSCEKINKHAIDFKRSKQQEIKSTKGDSKL